MVKFDRSAREQGMDGLDGRGGGTFFHVSFSCSAHFLLRLRPELVYLPERNQLARLGSYLVTEIFLLPPHSPFSAVGA